MPVTIIIIVAGISNEKIILLLYLCLIARYDTLRAAFLYKLLRIIHCIYIYIYINSYRYNKLEMSADAHSLSQGVSLTQAIRSTKKLKTLLINDTLVIERTGAGGSICPLTSFNLAAGVKKRKFGIDSVLPPYLTEEISNGLGMPPANNVGSEVDDYINVLKTDEVSYPQLKEIQSRQNRGDPGVNDVVDVGSQEENGLTPADTVVPVIPTASIASPVVDWEAKYLELACVSAHSGSCSP